MMTSTLFKAERLAHENLPEDKDLDELYDLKDQEDEEFLAQCCNKRRAELSNLQKASVVETDVAYTA
jgi:hypothetical protein